MFAALIAHELRLSRPMALIAAVAALVVGVRARWSAARWVLVLPGLVIAPVLIWEPRIAPDLMWWGRRYVPMVVPTLLLLAAVCLNAIMGAREQFAEGVAKSP